MDDTHIYTGENKEVLLGAYGLTEWIDTDFRRSRHIDGLQTLQTQQNWLVPADFKLNRWVVEENFEHFTFVEDDHVLIRFEDGLLNINSSKNKIHVSSTGRPSFCAHWESFFASRFKKAEHLIRWVYNSRGDDISVPLNFRPAIQAAYPWVKGSVTDYINSYLSAEASVLILIGPPGTGKTTFIKNIIHQSKGGARVAYDEKVLGSDDFFAMFIDGNDDILVMEDADTFLSSRHDGNSMMHKFLNVSDGLISTLGKKLIFSTNLPNVNDIDSALTRTGRCYDVLQFRPLDRTEAQAVLDEVGSDRALPDGSEFTLAEIFTEQPSAELNHRRSVGFL